MPWCNCYLCPDHIHLPCLVVFLGETLYIQSHAHKFAVTAHMTNYITTLACTAGLLPNVYIYLHLLFIRKWILHAGGTKKSCKAAFLTPQTTCSSSPSSIAEEVQQGSRDIWLALLMKPLCIRLSVCLFNVTSLSSSDLRLWITNGGRDNSTILRLITSV